jgi:hypothetical protein
MWHALRAEIEYFWPWLLGGLGIAVGVVVIISVVFWVVGADGPPSHAAAGIRGMFLIMAPMIVGFISQAYRSEERRARLLLAGPLTPRQIAGVMVILPLILFVTGALAAGLVIGAGALVSGKLELETLNIVGFVGGLMLAYVQMGVLAQEATAAHNQRRRRAATIGWAAFVVTVMLLAALYLVLALQLLTWNHIILGHLIVAVTAMVASVALYTGRTDFTR